MPKLLKIAAIAVSLAGAALLAACVDDGHERYPHQMRAGVSVGFGEVAYGYRDGYWDNDHRWHNWEHDADAGHYRNTPNNAYHDWDHTRDPNKGWYDRGSSGR